MRVRPPLQGLPRPRRRAGGRAVRRPARSRACPASATGSRCARSSRPPPRRSRWPGARRPRGHAGHRAADGLARPGPAGRRGCTSGCRCPAAPATPAATSPHALEQALDAEPGTPIAPTALPGPGARLQDLLDPTAAARGRRSTTASTSGSRASTTAAPRWSPRWSGPTRRWCPTVRLTVGRGRLLVPDPGPAATCAGSCRTTRTPCSTRWPGCTPPAPTRSARTPATSASFRAHGLVVPVWDLEPGTSADALEEPVDRVRRPAGRGAGRQLAARRRRAAGQVRPAQPAAHPALTMYAVSRLAQRTALASQQLRKLVLDAPWDWLAGALASDIVADQARALLHPPSVALGPFHVRPAAGPERRISVVGGLPPAADQVPSGSRLIGQDMHRGPPRPLPSSLPAIRTTSMPASSSRALVSTLRS